MPSWRVGMSEQTSQELPRFFEGEKPIVVAYLFGSMAKGTAGRLSDVDIAILMSRDYRPTLDYHLYLMSKLANILRREVDIVMLNEAPPLLRFEVIKHGKVLYCRDEIDRVAFEERTIDEYLDMNNIEKEYLECLLRSVR